MKQMIVAAAVIMDGDDVLVAQRKDDCRMEPGKWEFPGGKVEFGEHPKEALSREIMEELGLRIKVGTPLGATSIVKDGIHLIMLAFLCRIEGGKPIAIEVKDFRWVRREELPGLDWAAADIPILRAF